MSLTFENFISGSAQVTSSKNEFNKQRSNLEVTENTLRLLEKESKYFRVGILDGQDGPDAPASYERVTKRWFSAKDLEHAAEMNQVGYGTSTRSYNHAKYRRDQPSHLYRLCGDILKPGNDFTGIENIKPKINYQRVVPKSKRYTIEPFLPSMEADVDLPINIPPNIKHQFGSKVCNHLLNDKTLVDETLGAHKRNHVLFYKKNQMKPKVTPDRRSKGPDTLYDRMGNTFRTNMFPGYAQDHKRSLAHSVYTQEVYDRRPEVPDKWRYKRDELSKYVRGV